MVKNCIAFIADKNKNAAVTVRDKSIRIAQDKGFRCENVETAEELTDDQLRDILFFAAIGGDGTILKSVPVAVVNDIPILGINTGRVGFLSEIQPFEFDLALSRILSGQYEYEKRSMLECSVHGKSALCLNEALLYKRTFSGVAHLSLYIDELFAGNVSCDGIIACTPTGATGYSISAGGPIVAPGADVCIVTPICPHSLSSKPIVTSPDAVIEIVMQSEGTVYVDGQKTADLSGGDRIRITKSNICAKFMRFEQKNLYTLIKEKLV